MSRPTCITLEDCQALFYLPVAQAAAVLGVSRPTISKVLRAHGIKRWPFRKLRAQGLIDTLRQRREAPHIQPLPVLPPLPPPLPPFLPNPNNNHNTSSHTPSVKSEPLFPEKQATPDDETYILHLLDRPISPTHQMEDHTHPFLSLGDTVWTCDEQLPPLENDDEEVTHTPPSPLPHNAVEFDDDTRSHTISTVRPAARAVIGAGNWSRGVFQTDGDRTSFAFLPSAPFGSSMSNDDPIQGIGSE